MPRCDPQGLHALSRWARRRREGASALCHRAAKAPRRLRRSAIAGACDFALNDAVGDALAVEPGDEPVEPAMDGPGDGLPVGSHWGPARAGGNLPFRV